MAVLQVCLIRNREAQFDEDMGELPGIHGAAVLRQAFQGGDAGFGETGLWERWVRPDVCGRLAALSGAPSLLCMGRRLEAKFGPDMGEFLRIHEAPLLCQQP
jgi:hypothetical protein